MDIWEFIAKFLGFRTIPTTVVVVLIYVIAFAATLWTDAPARVPRRQKGLNLTEAYADLHVITRHPHPYNSHANDLVHDYILDRVTNITTGCQYAEVDNDLRSNGSWAEQILQGAQGVYFEGTNILVKIEGTNTDADSDAVLFSAHYDSVSTAPGVTDDGMGVVTLIQLIRYLTVNRPRRTAVFNINNGEEDWLNGAQAFLQHPWSRLTRTFLNLEGAASGGRPLLFRATSTAPLRSFRGSNVNHPHANVLSADAFARGVIKSGTDYQVYAKAGMEGIDLAFYKGRSKYHTRFDTIPHTEGEEASLWAMMDAARGSGLSLLNDNSTHQEAGAAVYFDLFSRFFVLFSLDHFIIYDICLAILGPMLVIGMRIAEIVIQRDRRLREEGDLPENERTWRAHIRTWFIGTKWVNEFWRLSKLWIALIVGVGLQVALGAGMLYINPFIVHSQPYLVALSSFSLAYLSMYLLLNFPLTFARYGIVPAEASKHLTILQTYTLTWVLLVLTLIIGEAGVHDNYLIPIWNTCLFLACLVGSVGSLFGAEGTFFRYRTVGPHVWFADPDGHHDHISRENGREENADVAITTPNHEEPTENTPLIRRVPIRSTIQAASSDQGGAIGWWLLEALIVIPIPVTLLSHISVLLLSSMAQTLTDGNNAVTVYGAIFLLSFLLVLPSAPFIFRLHRWLTYFMLLVFIITAAYTWIAFPFDQDSPFKVMFKQTVSLDALYPHNTEIATTTLTGVEDIVRRGIIPKLPSAAGKEITCAPSTRLGLVDCSWETDLLPSPGLHPFKWNTELWPTPKPYWLTVGASRYRVNNFTTITLSGTNTRNCRLYFDNQKITKYTVRGSDGTMQPAYPIPPDGISELRLWSRTWRPIASPSPRSMFTVDIEYDMKKTLKGRAACEWNEYESGTIGIGTGGKIPAFEEILMWIPKWAAVHKSSDGLVEVSHEFRI